VQQPTGRVTPTVAPGMAPSLSSFVFCPLPPVISTAPCVSPLTIYQMAYRQAELDARRWHWQRRNEPSRN